LDKPVNGSRKLRIEPKSIDLVDASNRCFDHQQGERFRVGTPRLIERQMDEAQSPDIVV
jgi:hypothetical protein